MQTWLRLGVAAAAATLGCVTLHACANSILRNAGEAGLETILEEPLPTPTAASGSIWKPATNSSADLAAIDDRPIGVP
jgi:hypothetical protein